MRKTGIVLVLVALLSITVKAQNYVDSLAIDKACRDYVEGWALGDVNRVHKAISDELVKRTIGADKSGLNFIINMSASQLEFLTKRNAELGVNVKDLEPDKEFMLKVEIFDITGNYALAKASNTKYGFFDYCQLTKYNGEWKIINVLYGWLPQENK